MELFGFVHFDGYSVCAHRLLDKTNIFFNPRLEEQPSDAPPLKPELLVDPSDEHPSLVVEFAFKVRDISLKLHYCVCVCVCTFLLYNELVFYPASLT